MHPTSLPKVRSKDATSNKSIATSNKCLTSSNKNATRGAPGLTTRNKKLLGAKGIATSNKCIARASLNSAFDHMDRSSPLIRTIHLPAGVFK